MFLAEWANPLSDSRMCEDICAYTAAKLITKSAGLEEWRGEDE